MPFPIRATSLLMGAMAILAPTLTGCDGCKKQIARQMIAAAARATKVDRGFHVIDGDVVFLDWNAGDGKINRKVAEADPKTFRTFEQPSIARALFAADNNHVFMAELYRVVVIAGADPKTFEVLTSDGSFARDSKNAFYVGVALKDAHPASFQVIKSPFAKDEKRAYVGTIPIPVQDIASWTPLERGHAEDPWYRPHNEKFPKPHDGLTGRGWSQDKVQVYWGHRPVKDADSATFEALGQFYAKDSQRVYFGGQVIEGADSATFVAHDGPFIGDSGMYSGPGPDAHDAQRQYKSGRVHNR